MPARTSVTHPIRVDFVSPEEHGLPGRLGMTFAPGKRADGVEGRWERHLAADVQRLRDEYATDFLISLIEPHEYELLHITGLPDAAEAAGISIEQLAIRDGGVPDAPLPFAQLVDRTVRHLRRGKTVVIHCRGGLGRTGILAAACLRALGHDAARAMAAVRAAREGTIENAKQEAFVRDFVPRPLP